MSTELTVTPPHILVAAPGPAVLAYLRRMRTPSGRRSALSAVRGLTGLLGGADPLEVLWHQLGAAGVSHLVELVARSGLAPATRQRYEAALRGLLKECWRSGQLSAEELAKRSDFPSTRLSRPEGHLGAGRRLSTAELQKLVRVARVTGGTPEGKARNWAAVVCLVATGLRREELGKLQFPTSCQFDAPLPLAGKGGKPRWVALPGWAQAVLVQWAAVRGAAPGPLFPSVYRSGRIDTTRTWSAGSISKLWVAVTEGAGVVCGLHDVRRTWVSDRLAAGVDLVLVSKAAGHSSPATTAAYDRRPLAALQSMAEAIPPIV